MAAATAGAGDFGEKWVFALHGMIDCFCYLKKKQNHVLERAVIKLTEVFK